MLTIIKIRLIIIRSFTNLNRNNLINNVMKGKSDDGKIIKNQSL